MKKILAFLTTILLLLSGCSLTDSPRTTTAPGRMVVQIDVSFTPENEEFLRVYTQQDTLDSLLVLLRNMQTGEVPDAEPSLTSGQSYYTIRLTYANGNMGEYHLMGHSWLQIGGEWSQVDTGKAMGFVDFLKSHPSEPDNTP